jgi:hypothetical protein
MHPVQCSTPRGIVVVLRGMALAMALLVAGCGGGGGGGDPPDGSEPPPGGGGGGNTGPCAVTISEAITVPTRLSDTGAACDYLMKNVVLTISSTLTIDPGVVIKAAKDTSLDVDGGEIIAVGRADARITLQGESAIQGFWSGISLSTSAGRVQLEYVDISDAGQVCTIEFCPDAALVSFGGGQLTLTNSTISNSYVNGATLGLELVAFANNRFFNNRWAGLVIDADKVSLLDPASDYTGGDAPNGSPFVTVSVGSTVAHAATWPKLGAPYLISGYVNVEALLTIAPGVTLMFDSSGEGDGAWMSIEPGGSIQAIGTPDEHIVFTRAPGVQYWGGLNFGVYNDSTDNRFEHVDMSYGGDNEAVAFGMLSLDTAQVHVANSSFQNSARWGIDCYSAGYLVLGPGNSFAGNAVGDVRPDCGVQP